MPRNNAQNNARQTKTGSRRKPVNKSGGNDIGIGKIKVKFRPKRGQSQADLAESMQRESDAALGDSDAKVEIQTSSAFLDDVQRLREAVGQLPDSQERLDVLRAIDVCEEKAPAPPEFKVPTPFLEEEGYGYDIRSKWQMEKRDHVAKAKRAAEEKAALSEALLFPSAHRREPIRSKIEVRHGAGVWPTLMVVSLSSSLGLSALELVAAVACYAAIMLLMLIYWRANERLKKSGAGRDLTREEFGKLMIKDPKYTKVARPWLMSMVRWILSVMQMPFKEYESRLECIGFYNEICAEHQRLITHRNVDAYRDSMPVFSVYRLDDNRLRRSIYLVSCEQFYDAAVVASLPASTMADKEKIIANTLRQQTTLRVRSDILARVLSDTQVLALRTSVALTQRRAVLVSGEGEGGSIGSDTVPEMENYPYLIVLMQLASKPLYAHALRAIILAALSRLQLALQLQVLPLQWLMLGILQAPSWVLCIGSLVMTVPLILPLYLGLKDLFAPSSKKTWFH